MTESERAGFEEVVDEAHAEELRVAAVRGMEQRLAGFSAHTFLPARLSGRRADSESGAGCLPDGGFETLRGWVQQCSAAVDARHLDRDAKADERGYCELYAQHWQDKAVGARGQQQAETENCAWWWRAGPAPEPEDSWPSHTGATARRFDHGRDGAGP